ncbi:MAG: thiazole synthase, partial [Halothermotrichaceae bacterium]
MSDKLIIAGQKLDSRLFIGTGKFSNKNLILEAVKKSRSKLVTAALRRVDFEEEQDNILSYIPEECIVMINTSGAR